MRDYLYLTKKGHVYNKKTKRIFMLNNQANELLLKYKNKELLGKDEEGKLNEILSIVDNIGEENKNEYKVNNKEVSLQLLVCNACNMACKYCYANDGTYDRKGEIMKFDIAKKAIDYMFEKYNEINSIIFFGGEPLLAIELIEQVCSYLMDKYKNRYKKLIMMSNLYDVNDYTIDVIKKYDIQVGTSLDGNKELNLYRVDKKGKETYLNVVDNINRMYEKIGQPIAVEVTMSNLHSDCNYNENRVIEEMKKILPIKNYTVNKVENFDDKMNNCAYEGKLSNVEERINQFIETGIYDMVANNLVAVINKKGCGNLFCDAGINKFTVLPDGDIYPCQIYSLDKEKQFLMSNIKNIEDEYFDNKIIEVERFSNKETYEKCKKCYAKSICTSCLGMKVALEQAVPKSDSECKKMCEYHEELIEIYSRLLSTSEKYVRFKEKLKEVNSI